MDEITIITDKLFSEEENKLIQELEFEKIQKKSLLGGSEELILFGTLTASTITAITKIIVEIIRSKNKVEIEVNGNKIKNISEQTVKEILSNKIGK